VVAGSEYDSDENVDLDERDDVLEQEAGDADDVGPEEDLRNQVHRVHMWVGIVKLSFSLIQSGHLLVTGSFVGFCLVVSNHKLKK